MKKLQKTRVPRNSRKWLIILLISWLLVTPVRTTPPVHAANTYHVTFSTSNFGVQFLHAQIDDSKNAQQVTFSLTNGAVLWYGIQVQSQPAGLRPVAADPLHDLVSSELAQYGLLPPADILPLNINGSFFENVQLVTAFSAPGQSMQITLDPFNGPAASLDVLNLLLQFLGETSTSVQIGLLSPGNLQLILKQINQAKDLVALSNDFIALLHAVVQKQADVEGEARSCAKDLFALFTHNKEVITLGKILAWLVGRTIPGIAEAVVSFATGINTFLSTIKVAKFLADLALSLGSYLFLQGVFPTVTLQSVTEGTLIPPTIPYVGAIASDLLNPFYPAIPPTSSQDTIFALDPVRRKVSWKQSLMNVNSLTVTGNIAYVGANGTIYLYNIKDGVLLKHYTLGFFTEGLAITNGIIYVEVFSYDTNQETVSSLYALNATTGLVLWKYSIGILALEGIPVAATGIQPMVVNNVVYFASENGQLYALDASNGALLWKYNLQSAVSPVASPVMFNGIIYVVTYAGIGVGGTLYALDAKNGSVHWKTEVSGGGPVSLLVDKDAVYIGTNNQLTFAFRTSDGQLQWQASIGSGVGDEDLLAMSNGIIYVSSSGVLHALRASNGKQLWSVQKGQIGSWLPYLMDGVVYFASNSSSGLMVTALRANNGAILWSVQVP